MERVKRIARLLANLVKKIFNLIPKQWIIEFLDNMVTNIKNQAQNNEIEADDILIPICDQVLVELELISRDDEIDTVAETLREMLKELPAEILVTFIRELLDKIEEKVEATHIQIDDYVYGLIKPLIEKWLVELAR